MSHGHSFKHLKPAALGYLFPSSRLFLSQVFFPTAITHQVPGAASYASISTVPSPTTTEVANAVVALASSIAATTYQGGMLQYILIQILSHFNQNISVNTTCKETI